MMLASFVFEGVLAVLMVVLIVYCVKLNRGLAAIRSSDVEINQLIASLVEASDRAEASVAQLKAVGVAQERALRAAIEDAESVLARLAPAARAVQGAGEAPPPGDIAAPLEAFAAFDGEPRAPVSPARRAEAGDDSDAASQEHRRETKQALLAAIRQARAAG